MKKYIINGKEIDLIPYDRDTTLDQASHLCSSKLNQIIQALGTPVPEPKKEFKRWRAEEGETYWFLVNSDVCEDTESFWYQDNCRYATGNYHQAQALAQKDLDKQIALTKLNDIINEKNEDWVADWDNKEQLKTTIAYDYLNKRFMTDTYSFSQRCPFILPIRSIEIGKEITKNHKDLLDTIWGVESK
jgi:hypothetical protein